MLLVVTVQTTVKTKEGTSPRCDTPRRYGASASRATRAVEIAVDFPENPEDANAGKTQRRRGEPRFLEKCAEP
jgi:hypothetical protein